MKKKEPKKKILEYVFSILAPETPLRSAIDRVQEASLGAIVVLGDSSDLSGIIRGGFKLNTPYTPRPRRRWRTRPPCSGRYAGPARRRRHRG